MAHIVKPADRDRLDDVRRVLGRISPDAGQLTGRDEVTVPVDNELALGATVTALTAEGIAVVELSLHLSLSFRSICPVWTRCS